MKRTVVVTGASGFIGRALSATLALSGVVVRPVSRSSGEGWQQLADYRDTPSADVLVHLAEANDRGRANAAGEAGYDAAIETMEAVLGKSYQRVIYASSSVLYGDAESRAREPGDRVQLVDNYTKTKWLPSCLPTWAGYPRNMSRRKTARIVSAKKAKCKCII